MNYPKTKEEMLVSTVLYYGADRKRRNELTEGNCCKYYSNNKDLSQGCAIGRFLDDELAQQLDSQDQTGVRFVFNLLPNELKLLDVGFLSEIQWLHDRSSYWDVKGLTDEGKERIEFITGVYNLDRSKLKEIQKYLN